MGQTLCVCSRGTVSLGGARYLLLHRLAEGCAAGWGAGDSGGSFPVLREGCSGKGGVLGPRACSSVGGMLGHGCACVWGMLGHGRCAGLGVLVQWE